MKRHSIGEDENYNVIPLVLGRGRIVVERPDAGQLDFYGEDFW